jgi:hypothetical protein
MNTKRFKVENFEGDSVVIIEVDMDKLTEEAATEINTFWNNAERRLRKRNGNVIHVVIGLYAAEVIHKLQVEGADEVYGEYSKFYTKFMEELEGWPNNGTFKVIEASTWIPDSDELEIREINV